MTDPLAVLRDFIKDKQQIYIDGNDFVFGDLRFPKTEDTSFINKTKGSPYSLEAIWFMLQNATSRHGEYLVKATRLGIPAVSLPDKSAILTQLFGKPDITAEDIPTALTAEHLPASSSVAGTKHALPLSEESSAKKARTDEGDMSMDISDVPLQKTAMGDTIQEITSRERLLRTRATVLQSNKKIFTGVFENVKDVLRREDERKRIEQQKEAERKRKTVNYDRYNISEDQFWKDRLKETSEFQINTRGTFSGLQPGKLAEAAAEVTKASKKPPSSSSGKPPSSFSSSSSQAPRPHQRPPSQSSSSSSASAQQAKPKLLVPIVVILGGFSNLLTLYNVQELLMDNHFISSTDKKNAPGSKPPPPTVTLTHPSSRKQGSTVQYQFIDNINRLDSKDWTRVAAVFVTDQSWQFKGWKWNIPEVFSHVRGFYLGFDDQPVPAAVKAWDVKILLISKHKRHLDATAVLDFWSTLEDFIIKKKPHLTC